MELLANFLQLFMNLYVKICCLSRCVRRITSTKHYMKSAQIRRYFWSVVSCIRIEYGDLLCKSPYSIRIQENTDQTIHTFHAVKFFYSTWPQKNVLLVIFSDAANPQSAIPDKKLLHDNNSAFNPFMHNVVKWPNIL